MIQGSKLLYDLDVVSIIGDRQAGTRTSNLNGIHCHLDVLFLLATILPCQSENGGCGDRGYLCVANCLSITTKDAWEMCVL